MDPTESSHDGPDGQVAALRCGVDKANDLEEKKYSAWRLGRIIDIYGNG